MSCSKDDNEEDMVKDKIVVIKDDGTTSNGSIFSAINDKNFYLDYIKYSVEEGHLVVSGYDKVGFKGEAKIASGITYKNNTYEVLEIKESAFEECSSLTSVTISNSVTTIEKRAFFNCRSLISVTIGNSVTSIGDYAFSGCSDLYSITIPNSVTKIGYFAFYGCHNLNSVTIPNNVTSINNYAFRDCSGLISITIPNSVKFIGEYAFYNCRSLNSVTIPNSVTSIESSAFWGCSGLTSIVVEEGNTNYDSRDNCNAIIEKSSNTLISGCKNTTIPNSVTSIRYGAFFRCSSMTSITFPNSLTNIGTLAFYSCSALTSITIPNSVTSIARRAFEGCNGLTSIVVEEGNTKYDSRDNCNAIIETLSNTLICGFKNTTIPNSVTCIGSEAFYGCSDLTSITIPNSVKNIDYYAFEGCSGLTDIYCYAEIVPKADSDFFGKTSINTIILHVPAASIKAYKTTTPWSRFKEIVALN